MHLPTNGLLVLPLIFGLVIGSFLNVLVYRLPRELSIINPGSFCPKCKNKITFYRNIPLLSYIMQKGRCAYCNDRISIRYPLIELATGVIWFFSFLNYQISVATPFALFVTILLAISVIDAEFLIIPFSLLLSGLVVIVIDTVIHPKMIMDSIYGVLFGFAYLGSIMLITKWIFKKQTMGYGDLLLVVILGAWVDRWAFYYQSFYQL